MRRSTQRRALTLARRIAAAVFVIGVALLASACVDYPPPAEKYLKVVQYPVEWGRIVSVGGHCGCLATTVDSAGVARSFFVGSASGGDQLKVVPMPGLLTVTTVPVEQPDGTTVR
jgi:hypothetical protein